MVRLTVKRQEMTIAPTYTSTRWIQSNVMEYTAIHEKTKAGRGAPVVSERCSFQYFPFKPVSCSSGRGRGRGVGGTEASIKTSVETEKQ